MVRGLMGRLLMESEFGWVATHGRSKIIILAMVSSLSVTISFLINEYMMSHDGLNKSGDTQW